MHKLLNKILLATLCGFIVFAEATYSIKVIVKFPFASGRFDAQGNWISDSLVRYHEITMVIHYDRDSLIHATRTNEMGEAHFFFDVWHDGTPVDTHNIEKMDIIFPNTEQVIKTKFGTIFEPLRYNNINFKKDQKGITIVLPLTVTKYVYTIGAGPFKYDFVIMADMHIAEGKQNNDFGTDSYYDYDDNPYETTFAIENDKNIVTKINDLMGPGYNYPIKFVVCLGDMSHSSERSEYQRAKKLLSNLQVPWIPVFGNHDTWPYVGRIVPWGYNEQPANQVIIGDYFYNGFRDQFDSLSKFFPIPN